MPSFLGGKSRGAFRKSQLAFFLAGNRMNTVAFEKEVLKAFKLKSLFSKTIVRQR